MNRRTPISIFCLILLVGLSSTATAQFEEARFESDGVEIRYVTAGEGDPVILVHGFSASAAANWMLPGVFSRLSQSYRVIAIDARGHGGSDKPREPEAYGEKMAKDVVNLMDHLEIDRAHVGGYSMGAFITMKLIASAPERLRSAIVGGAGWMRPEEHRSLMDAVADSLESGGGVTPLLDSLMQYARRPIGNFHALPIARGNSIFSSRWIEDMGSSRIAGASDLLNFLPETVPAFARLDINLADSRNPV